MVSYSSTFGGNAIKAADQSLTVLSMSVNTQMNWPSTGQSPSTSAIMRVTATVGGLNLIMPPASRVSKGETLMIKNVGSNSFNVVDYASGAIVTIASGTSYIIYVVTNATDAGTWDYIEAGAGSSMADASSLDGNGLEASGGLLRVRSMTELRAITSSVGEAERGKTIVWTGSGGDFTFDAAATLTDGWHVWVKNNGGGTITLNPTGSETFDGAADFDVDPGKGVRVSTDGSNFFLLAMDPAETEAFTYSPIAVPGTGTYTLSAAEYANKALKFTGILTGNRTIVVPTVLSEYWVTNATTGAYTLTIKTLAGTGVAVTQTKAAILYCDGTNVVAAETDEGAGISTPVSIADGGTGASDANTALSNLGGTATGISLFTAANAAGGRAAIAAAGTGVANTFTAEQTIQDTDAGAAEGFGLTLDRFSASPANNDILNGIKIAGRSSTAVSRVFARIRGVIKTVTNGAEDGLLAIRTILAGTEADRFIVGAGLYGAGTTGGDKGANTINVDSVYRSNVLLTDASTTEALTGTDAAKFLTANAAAALWEKGSDIASAGTISVAEGGLFHVTGTTTITDIDFATAKDGRGAWLIFDGALTLTHHATTLILPGGANITTAAGDMAYVVQDNGDNIKVAYFKVDGTPVVSAGVTRISGNSGAAGATETWQSLSSDYTNATGTPSDVMTTTSVGTGFWEFEYHLIVRNSSSSGGFQVTVAHGGTVSEMLYDYIYPTSLVTASFAGFVAEFPKTDGALSIAGSAVAAAQAARASGTAVGNTDFDGSNSDVRVTIRGTMVVTGSGSLVLQGRRDTGGTVTIKDGSNLVLKKIA